jgi:hypothetical protein
MTSYPRFKTTSNKFNENDIVSNTESAITIDLSSYVPKSNPVFQNDVYLTSTSKMIFGNGDVQESAFTETQKDINADNKVKLSNVSYSNNTTEINGSLKLTSTSLQLNNEQIPISKITNLTSKLTEIDDNLNAIQNNDDDILELQNASTAHTGRLDNHDVNLATLLAETISNNNGIQVNVNSISNLNSSVAAIQVVDSAQDGSIAALGTLTASHTANLSDIESDISLNVKPQISATLASLNDYQILNDAALALSNSNILTNTTDISDQGVRLDAIDLLNNSQSTLISAAELDIVNNKIDQDTLAIRVDGHDILLADFNLFSTANASSISKLETADALQSVSISALEASSSQNTLNILANTTAISTKQPTVTSSNRLPASLIGNGDVSSEKLSMLNNMNVSNGSLQSQLDTINLTISGLDALQDLDLVNIPQLQTDVSTIQTALSVIDTELDALESTNNVQQTSITSLLSSNTAHDSDISSLQSLSANQAASITTLVGADTIHDSQISDLVTADGVLQANIDLKNDLISLSNNLDSSLVFDTNLNEDLGTILSTVDSNIISLNSSKQDEISGINKLNSLYLDLSTTALQYVDITTPLKAQLTNITSAISLLQGTDLTTIETISDNFESLNTSLTAVQNSISTLQGLQDGDIVSFASINSSITNLTNTKQPLIDNSNKLSSSLLTRDDNLQYVDVSGSISDSLTGLQTNLDAKQNTLNSSNKLAISNVDLGASALSYVDIGSSLVSSLSSINASIATLSAADVSQIALNTNFTTDIAANASAISNIDLSGIVSNATAIATNATNIAANASAISSLDLSAIATNATAIATNATAIATNATAIATNTAAISELSPDWTVDNLFSDFVANMPALEASRPLMEFQINGENYKVIQSSFYGMFESGTQNLAADTKSVQNLFDADNTVARLGYQNNWWVNDNDVLVRYTTQQYNYSGTYFGGLSQLDINSNAYAGEYIEIQTPKYFTPTEVVFYAFNTIQMPIIVHLLGSNDNTDYELIQTLTNTASLSVTHDISNASKYKTFKFVFAQAGTHPGIALTGLTMAGIGSNSLLSSVEKITLLETFQSEQETLNSSQTTINSTLQTNIDNIDLSGIVSNATNIATNTAAIATNTAAISNIDLSGIVSNATAIATNATNIAANASAISNIDLSGIVSNAAAIATQLTVNTTLQNNIDNKKTKTENIAALSYNQPTNVLTHVYNEENLFVNTLDDTDLMELQLTINSVENNKTYNQRVIIDALQHKSYVNVLKINGDVVEIKHRDGDSSINLAPIAGYSMIEQFFTISRVNNEWYVQSNIELFFNSSSNRVYDATPPIITLTGSATVSHEVNTTYAEPGYSASDDPGTIDITSDVVVGGDTVDTSVLGAVYNITYNVVDANGNAGIQKIRTVNIVDTTNPVITLVTPEITIEMNSVYDSSLAGASASDNSGETLTIVVDASGLDVNTQGAYTVTFTATDSSGNSHSINQIVNVAAPAMTLQYDNPSKDLFSLCNFQTKIKSQTLDTQANWTETTGLAWQQGDYQVYSTSYRGGGGTADHHFHEIFRGKLYSEDSKYFEFRLTSHPWIHQDYGSVTALSNSWTSAGSYQSFIPYNSTGGNLSFTTPGCETGEYIEVSLPFHVKPSRFTVAGSLILPYKFQVVATLDNGANWDILGYITPGNITGTFHLNLSLASDFTGYNKFRLICYQNNFSSRAFFDKFQMYGKVYTF